MKNRPAIVRWLLPVSVAVIVTVLVLVTAVVSRGEDRWYPSRWGAADQRGSGNHMTPETVLRAARLMRTGEVFELGRVLSESMPMPAGTRTLRPST